MSNVSVAADQIVSIHYSLEDAESSEALDSSGGGAPLEYLHGRGQLVPGLEKALEGKDAGEKLEVKIPPEEAYGVVDAERIIKVPRENFDEDVEVGQAVQAATPDGHPIRLRVTAVEGDEITLDANHPLAGRTLAFSVEIVAVRPATEEELTRSHHHCGSGSCGSGSCGSGDGEGPADESSKGCCEGCH
ncbi:MAG: peptidylprolyl isomerase [Deltaproteobacteria bacterium]|nr:peptidylprolyl isomerase [Deltaproteobacteria bacterium]